MVLIEISPRYMITNRELELLLAMIKRYTSVVSYINRAFRKPLKPRVQGAARR
jgi:hypothetical protein